jgi:LacI family transcriptional regulator
MSTVTIRDIARALKIDPSTVSCCLSGNAEKRRISPERIEEVRRTAAAMGYIPNKLASRIFRRNNKKYLGLIVKNDTANSRVFPVLDYVLQELSQRNDCDFSVLYARGDDFGEAVRNGIGLGIRDFIVIGYARGIDLKQIDLARLPDIRIYAADYCFGETDDRLPEGFFCVGFDRTACYRELAGFLNAAGYGPVNIVQAYRPGENFQKEPDKIYYPFDGIMDLFAFGAEYLAPLAEERIRSGKCRTLLLRNDSLAIGVMDTLLAHGIRIPEDVAVIGFNNAPFSAYAKVPLASIAPPVLEGVNILLKGILEDREILPAQYLTPTLVLRRSVPDWDWSSFPFPVVKK